VSCARIVTLLCAAALLANSAYAATVHMPAEYPTIQAGIDAAVAGDTVLVAPGTYSDCVHFDEDGRRNCAIITRSVTLQSEGGPSVTTSELREK
jgi:pectin methylesterase-like acyl-CoA thioesterase